jgi:hypothetical protein
VQTHEEALCKQTRSGRANTSTWAVGVALCTGHSSSLSAQVQGAKGGDCASLAHVVVPSLSTDSPLWLFLLEILSPVVPLHISSLSA